MSPGALDERSPCRTLQGSEVKDGAVIHGEQKLQEAVTKAAHAVVKNQVNSLAAR
jgi:hypothetical protein